LSRRGLISAGFFILGLLLFGYLVFSFGIDNILRNVSAAGSGLAPAVLVWFAIYALNTASWKLVLGATGDRTPFWKLFRITVSGFVINSITPVVGIGGEPYKAQALSAGLGAHRAISAVVLYRMIHLIGHMLLLLAGIVTAIFVVRPGPAMSASLGAAAVVIAGVIVLTLRGTRHGVFDTIAGIIRKFRMLSFIPADRYRQQLGAMDAVLTDVYRNDRRTFRVSILLEFTTRLLMGAEVWIILGALGVDASPAQAVFVYVAFSIAINLMFFIPMGAGTQEGGILLGMQSLGLDPALAISVGVMLRIREFIWIGVGLLFIPFTGRENPPPEVPRAGL
jgi:uncharacterized protein (TIRG00374 family)